MFFRIFSYLKFLTTSTNQHGVHSPFVYNLATKCFYDKRKIQLTPKVKKIVRQDRIPKKHLLLVLKVLKYFKINEIIILSGHEEKSILQKVLPNITIYNFTSHSSQPKKSIDFLYLDISELLKDAEVLKNIFLKIHNDSILMISSIHQSTGSECFWNELKSNPLITVTIDTFYYGFVFFRKEQVKENFRIRV